MRHQNEYNLLFSLLSDQNGAFTLEQRKYFAKHSFNVSSHYDSNFNYFDNGSSSLKLSIQKGHQLRYGENLTRIFFGDLEQLFDKLNGKELSYNNLRILMLL